MMMAEKDCVLLCILNGAKQEMSHTTDGKTHVINGFKT
jgi:hypothetical protein